MPNDPSQIAEILSVWQSVKILSPFAALVIGILSYYLRDIAKSLRELNVTQVQVLERINSHDERLKRLERAAED